MRLPQKPLTKLFLMFSMFALMQCCCCVFPIRWRISTIPVPSNSPATVQPGDISQPEHPIQESSRTDGLAAQSLSSSGQEKRLEEIEPLTGVVIRMQDAVKSWIQRVMLVWQTNRH